MGKKKTKSTAQRRAGPKVVLDLVSEIGGDLHEITEARETARRAELRIRGRLRRVVQYMEPAAIAERLGAFLDLGARYSAECGVDSLEESDSRQEPEGE